MRSATVGDLPLVQHGDTSEESLMQTTNPFNPNPYAPARFRIDPTQYRLPGGGTAGSHGLPGTAGAGRVRTLVQRVTVRRTRGLFR